MKRTALILLTAIYLLSCVGMEVSRFFCCGKLASVTITYGAPDNIGNRSAKKDNCCKNEKQSFKVNDSHFSAASFSLIHPAPVVIPSFISLGNESLISLVHTKIVYKGNAPPEHSAIPAYTLNCTYRI